jgi:hypothetical protein
MRSLTGITLPLVPSQTACVVGAYSSEGGFFLRPGSILITVVPVLLFLFERQSG